MCVLVFCLCGPPPYLLASDQETLYIRLDIRTVNGMEVESNLLMLPAKDDYRTTTFSAFNVEGSCPFEAKPDTLSAAKHDAFKKLLTSFGVRSIRNTSETHSTRIHDESILSYEGFIKTPYDIVSQRYDPEKKIFSIAMEVSFAPLAYPPEWSFLYFKKKLYEVLHNMISVFR